MQEAVFGAERNHRRAKVREAQTQILLAIACVVGEAEQLHPVLLICNVRCVKRLARCAAACNRTTNKVRRSVYISVQNTWRLRRAGRPPAALRMRVMVEDVGESKP